MDDCGYCGNTETCVLDGECGRANALRARLAKIIKFCEDRAARWDDPDVDEYYAGQADGYKEACAEILRLAINGGDARV
jgi:hypothetical protein